MQSLFNVQGEPKTKERKTDTRFLNDLFTDIACKEIPAIPSAEQLKQNQSKDHPKYLCEMVIVIVTVCVQEGLTVLSVWWKQQSKEKVNNSEILFN